MRKVLLLLITSFLIVGILGAHADIPDSVTEEIPTPESEYLQDADVEVESVTESETVIVESDVDEVSEAVADELSAVDSEQVEEDVIETFNDDTDVQSESVAVPESVIVEITVTEVTAQTADEATVNSEATDETAVEPLNDTDFETESVAEQETAIEETDVTEVIEQVVDEVSATDSETTEGTTVELFDDTGVESENVTELNTVIEETDVTEITEQTVDELSATDSEATDETAVDLFDDTDVQAESVAEPETDIEETDVTEITEQAADEVSAVDLEQTEPLLIETEDVDASGESEPTPYAEDMEDMEENVAETEVSELVVADAEPIGEDSEDVEDTQMVMDIVPDEADNNDMEAVDVQAEEVELFVESDEKSGIKGKVLLSMEVAHYAWNFSSNGSGSGLALPCSGVSAEWLFSNRFACGIDVRVSTEWNGTDYRTNLGILNRLGMLSSVKRFLDDTNIMFFEGDVLFGLVLKDAVGGLETLPAVGLAGKVHLGRDFLTMAFGVDGTVMFPLSGANKTPVYSIRPNMAMNWIF